MPLEHALAGLLHDASEAYLVDLPRPVKSSIAQYSACEERLLRCIAKRYGIPFPFPKAVKAADNHILFNERDALLGPSEIPWRWELPPLDGVQIYAWPQHDAYVIFLHRFNELTKGR